MDHVANQLAKIKHCKILYKQAVGRQEKNKEESKKHKLELATERARSRYILARQELFTLRAGLREVAYQDAINTAVNQVGRVLAMKADTDERKAKRARLAVQACEKVFEGLKCEDIRLLSVEANNDGFTSIDDLSDTSSDEE